MNDKITITFPDGNSKTCKSGINGFEIAESISKSLAKESIAIKINSETFDLKRQIESDAKIQLIKKGDEEALDIIRHDCAHVMAEAVQQLFPGTQVTIGPAIDHGFYYDFAFSKPFISEDLIKIEKTMIEIIDKGLPFEREVWERNQAIDYFNNHNNFLFY